MSAQTKTLNNISSLEQEVVNLRSYIIGLAGQDEEGEYNPDFVKKILKTGQEPPIGKFTNSQEFLELIK